MVLISLLKRIFNVVGKTWALLLPLCAAPIPLFFFKMDPLTNGRVPCSISGYPLTGLPMGPAGEDLAAIWPSWVG